MPSCISPPRSASARACTRSPTTSAINDLGTAVLLEALLKQPVGRLVVASSMSVYGEGLARTAQGRRLEPGERRCDAAQARPLGAGGSRRRAADTRADARDQEPRPELGLRLNKFTQERLCLLFGRAYDIPTTALRFFNVYGTRQALSNPYTGVLAIFASRLLNGRSPLIFEDGQQRRDFVHVRDVARACLAALRSPRSAGHAINVGSGVSRTVEEVARALAKAVGRPERHPQDHRQVSGR